VRAGRGTRLLAGAALLAGCARNPATGRPEVVFVSEAGERELGAEQARDIEEATGLVRDPELVAYVEAIGRRLVAQAPHRDLEYRFFVADMTEPNAFALPGGYIYVSRGLLALANAEDELAGVIGHEIAHVAARHAVQRVSRGAPLAIVTGIAGAATGIVLPGLGRMVSGAGQLAGSVILAPYSRDQERQADELGQEMAARAGWDPAGLSALLTTLEREEALQRKGPERRSFLAGHPSTPERVGTTSARAHTLTRIAVAPIARDRAAFLARLEGLVIGPDPATGVFDGQRFLHPDLDFTILFPAGWKTENHGDFVAGREPKGEALVLLQLADEGNDPVAAARSFEKQSGGRLADAPETVAVGGLRGAHATAVARTDDGRVALDLTWIAYDGRIYLVTGMTAPRRAADYRAAFSTVARGFRSLTAAERAGISAARLRVRRAEAGETVAALAARAGGVWSADEVAIANALDTGARLEVGWLVKVAPRERYATSSGG
jgi:predicted Zn-dependent protease